MNKSYHEKLAKGESVEIEMPAQEESPAVEETPIENVEPLQSPPAEEEVKPHLSAESSPASKSNSENIRALREKAARAEKVEQELQEMRQKMAQYEQQVAPKQEAPADSAEDYKISPDDLVEGKHLSKYDKKMQQIEAQLKNYTTEQRIKAEFNDFDKVVNEQNLATLAKEHPQLANTLQAPGELYDKAVAAYTILKNMGIYKEDNYGPDRERAQKNAAKPRPLTSVSPQQGDSPLSHANAFANGLTDELKKKLHQEMVASMKNH